MKNNKPFIIFAILTVACAALHLAFFISADFADAFNLSVAHFFRFLLAKITSFLPFSLAEALILSSPVFVTLFIIFLNKKSESVKLRLIIAGKIFLCFIFTAYILFVITFASGYQAHALDKRLGFEKATPSEDELYQTLNYVIEKTNYYADKISFSGNGASDSPVNYAELSSILCDSYDSIFQDYALGNNFKSTVKPLLISPVMTYTHISGVYSFFSGEANLNTNYPDYVCVFSAAHELAHQRGVARENEANFLAYLVCIESDNDYLRYAGYLSMYGYLSSALRKNNYDLWVDAASNLSDKANGELIAYSDFFDKYRDSSLSEVSDAFNDTYLKLQGTQGVISYGMVADLAIAYHKYN